MAKHILGDESTVTRARVDDKVLEVGGESVDLTKDQVSRLEDMDGVVLSTDAGPTSGGEGS